MASMTHPRVDGGREKRVPDSSGCALSGGLLGDSLLKNQVLQQAVRFRYHPPMADKNDTDPDTALFRKITAGIRRLKQDRVTPVQSRPRPVPVQSLRDDQEVIASLLSDEYDPNAIETGEELLFLRPGVPLRVWRRFRRGHYAIEAELDLHGCNVPEARELVDHFLHRAQQHGQRCVRIIHGRGRSSAGKIPVLKGKVNGWLQQKDAVLGFCSARPNDGGTGALYVLLKRI